jgi:hypothetical protein
MLQVDPPKGTKRMVIISIGLPSRQSKSRDKRGQEGGAEEGVYAKEKA